MEMTSIVFGIVGGLALFLYGLRTLSDGLKKMAGDRLKEMLEKLTNRPAKGVLVGTFTVGVIQSSSIMMVTLIGLLNAGLLTLEQAVGVMLGAEIGTTITAQIVAFKIETFYLPIIAVGFCLYYLAKTKKTRYVGQAMLGFGILFLGMSIMKDGVRPFRSDPFALDILANFGRIPILGIIAGAIFTGIIQSSTATTGLVIAMGMENVITLPSAIAIIFGANIGTCITGLLASIGSSLSAKRTSAAQFFVNILGVALFFPFISSYAGLVAITSPNLPRQIANAHTIFNVTVTLIMLPLVGLIVAVVKKVVPGEEIRIDRGVKFLDARILNTPSLALAQALKETSRMAKMTSEMLKLSMKSFETGDMRLAKTVKKEEEAVDELDDIIEAYLTRISEKDLSEDQTRKLAILLHSIGDIERVGDHAHNIAELAEKKAKEGLIFSHFASEELQSMFEKVKNGYDKAIAVLENEDEELGKKVLDIEKEVDVMEREFEVNHLERLKKGICKPVSGPVFIDVIRNLERISDHSHNIVSAVLIGF
ncbi:MAG: Na/Pi cotransporter family protein [Candidatus Hydrothermarchaeales archaeon]